MGSTLRLIPAGVEVFSFSYGCIKSLDSLYDPRIFGPTQDLRCECGNYSGPDCPGRICYMCGVLCSADSADLRHKRLGHLHLPTYCPHPLAPSEDLDVFPIAPIAFRTNAAGKVNSLGKKYEKLVTCSLDLIAKLPPKEDTEAHYRAAFALDITELTELMARIIGCDESPDDDSLLPMIAQNIRTLDPNLHTLLHCCALVCDITTSI